MSEKRYTLGIDTGSTTVKVAILNAENALLFSDYRRHYANIQETLADLLTEACEKLGELSVSPVITGSGGLTLANHLEVPFVQEVIAVSTALQHYAPQTDVAIELGGEDAKIIYFEGGNIEQRMNGICAGAPAPYRPDGLSAADRRHRPQRVRQKLQGHLPHRRPLRRVCQDGYPAPDQRRGYQGGSGGVYLPGSGKPDHLRPGLRQAHPGPYRLSGRASAFPFGAAPGFYPHSEAGRGAQHHAGQLPSVRGHRLRHERLFGEQRIPESPGGKTPLRCSH